jgi:hypothetical protein
MAEDTVAWLKYSEASMTRIAASSTLAEAFALSVAFVGLDEFTD